MSDFYDEAAEPDAPILGPVFTATYESDSACCGDRIVPGEDIRADGTGGWIHADSTCEAIILGDAQPSRNACGTCFEIHAGECL